MIRLSSNQLPSLIPTCACLLVTPPALMTLAAIGILVPSLGVFVEVKLYKTRQNTFKLNILISRSFMKLS